MRNFNKQLYIDTLYLSWDIKDIVLVSNYETEFFKNYGSDFLGTSQGYNWFNTSVGRFGIIANTDHIFSAKAHAFILQYNNLYLLQNTIDNLKGVLKLDTLVMPFDLAIVKRIDFSMITNNVDFFELDVVSRYRSRTVISKNDTVETVYLGKRANGKVFRYYRKDIELLQDKNLVKSDYFRQFFTGIDFSIPVTVLELELHRKYLRRSFDFNYLKDIDTLLSISYKEFEDIRFYEPTDENLQHINNKNYNNIDYCYSFDFESVVDVPRVKKEYKPSLSILYSRLDKIVTNFCDKSGLKISKTEILLKVFEGEAEFERLSGFDFMELLEKYNNDDLYLVKL